MSKELTGRRALVTGASRGIGQAIALRLAEAGAAVACVATRLEGLEGTMRALAERDRTPENGGAHAFACDIASEEGVQRLVQELGAAGFAPNVLVNNAGITRDGLLLRMTPEDFDAVIGVNLRGVFLLCKALARPLMKEKDAAIINVGSVVGLLGNAGQANYAASKAGLIGFTKSLARELAGRGVTCNVVAPGFVETDMTDALNEDQKQKLLSGVPLGRFGSGDDVAGAVRYLASPAARYVTGAVLTVDGGMAM